MIDRSSRYSSVERAELTVTQDGEARTVRYLRRRFIPTPGGRPTLLRHSVLQGDRIDNVAALYFTDPTQFWRLCDANGVLHPDELVATVGRSISVVLALG